MYFVLINKKTGVILTTTDTANEAYEISRDETRRLISEGRTDPGWIIQERN